MMSDMAESDDITRWPEDDDAEALVGSDTGDENEGVGDDELV